MKAKQLLLAAAIVVLPGVQMMAQTSIQQEEGMGQQAITTNETTKNSEEVEASTQNNEVSAVQETTGNTEGSATQETSTPVVQPTTETKTLEEAFPDANLLMMVKESLNRLGIQVTNETLVGDVDLTVIKRIGMSFEKAMVISVNDFTGIELLTGLEEAIIKTDSIDRLVEFPTSVKTVRFVDSSITDYTKLSDKIPTATTLSIEEYENEGVVDFSKIQLDLKSLKNLTSFSIGDVYSIEKQKLSQNAIHAIAEAVTLQDLNIYSIHIGTIDNFANLENLISLTVVNSDLLNIRAVAQLTKLQKLIVSGNYIDNISPASNVPEVFAEGQVIVYMGLFPGQDFYIQNSVVGVQGNTIAPAAISHGGTYDAKSERIDMTGITGAEAIALTFAEGSAMAPDLPTLEQLSDIQSIVDSSVAATETPKTRVAQMFYAFSGTVVYGFEGTQPLTTVTPVTTSTAATLVNTGNYPVETIFGGAGISLVSSLLVVLRKRFF